MPESRRREWPTTLICQFKEKQRIGLHALDRGVTYLESSPQLNTVLG